MFIGGMKMKEYSRDYPLFSLCGVNCGLCPRYHTDGTSKCPGCGGESFHLKHPTCAIITCSKKHGNVEYCFQCSDYPCHRYAAEELRDSFISRKNVLTDFDKAKIFGVESYQIELNEKVEILRFLIENYNDGKRKNFYCIAINLLKLADIKEIVETINTSIAPQDIDLKVKVLQVVALFEAKAKEQNIKLTLRKKGEAI